MFHCIDATRATNYNESMEEWTADERVDDFICAERAEQKKGFLSNSGALYAALLVAVCGVIALGNAASARWNWPRAIVQCALYVVLLILAWLVYRFRLIHFRYVLTGRMLSVDRVVGRKIQFDTAVRLSDVTEIRPYGGEPGEGKQVACYTGRRRDALMVCAVENGKKRTLLIKPSEEFAGKLIEQWKSRRK